MKDSLTEAVSSGFFRKKKIFNTVLTVILLLAAVFNLLPFLWMLSTSFRVGQIPGLRPDNYKAVWSEVSFGLYYLNTFKVAAAITVGQLFCCSTAAYAFAKLNFRFKNIIFMLFIASMMLPWQAVMIPQFQIVQALGMYDTHRGYILAFTFSVFGIFMLRQFFLGIPVEISEAAKIDGCSEWRLYWQIILPLSKTGLSTLGIFCFTAIWNDYLAPLIYINSDRLRTIQLGLQSFQTEHSMDYGVMMAGTACALLPMMLIFAFGEKYFTQSIAFSGMKN
jgi:multiple sugar transport system permease protein